MGTKTFRELTTFKVGGKIRHYKEVASRDEVVDAVKFAKETKLPVFILGGGSDILASDKDFSGVVIHFTGKKFHIDDSTVTAEAGMGWDDLVEEVVQKNLQGIECLSGIPGSVGAAPIQNIGAYGQELKDTFVVLTAYDIEKEIFVEFNNKDCLFDYRESCFKEKENWQRFLIIDITLRLNKNTKPLVKYDSLKNYLTEKDISNPTLKEVRDGVRMIRKAKFEDPKDVGNAGSFFKNPIVNKETAEKLILGYPDISCRLQPDGTCKCFAGWFIEKAGWKGKTYKSAGVSPRHALVLINPNGNANAKDIIELSERIINDVDKKFGVKLEREVQLINF